MLSERDIERGWELLSQRYSSVTLFNKEFGDSLNANFKSWIFGFVSRKPVTVAHYRAISNLAEAIKFLCWNELDQGRNGIAVDKSLITFNDFIQQFDIFLLMEVPYSEWAEVVQALFSVFKSMSLNDSEPLDFTSKECKKIEKMAENKLNELQRQEKYDRLYSDYLNGAL